MCLCRLGLGPVHSQRFGVACPTQQRSSGALHTRNSEATQTGLKGPQSFADWTEAGPGQAPGAVSGQPKGAQVLYTDGMQPHAGHTEARPGQAAGAVPGQPGVSEELQCFP